MNELEAAMKRATYGRTFPKQSNTPSKQAKRADPTPPPQIYPMVIDIKRAVAGYYSLEVLDLDCDRRGVGVVRPRQIAMYLCCTMTRHSLPEIGRRMGGKDHTTVLHSRDKIEQLMDFETEKGAELRADIQAIKSLVLAKVKNGEEKQTQGA